MTTLAMPTRATTLAVAAVLLAGAWDGAAEDDGDQEIEEIVVVADLGSLPDHDVQSLFGFYKSLLETPRSASSISDEMLDRFIVRDIDEMIALAPGSFTQSFFGVAGTLDIRGTPGETYFRGMRRLDNPGNYPTPLGASTRVDIVRGPASPIHGPSKIGGYLNFNPTSARIEETGEFIADATGSVGLDVGSWDMRVARAELGGPGRIGGQDFGYWLFGTVEDSGSYYRNSATDQKLLQASFDLDVGRVQFQFGGMYHDFAGNQIAGWNRLTQALVDRGTYVTGSPRGLDQDGDGYISHQEFDVDGDGFTDFNPFAAGLVPGTSASLDPDGPFPGTCAIGATPVFGCRADLLGLVSAGTAQITGDQVLVGAGDALLNDVATLYFDAIFTTDGQWEWRNQAFYEAYDHLSENEYGFSQFHDSWVFEDKVVAAKVFHRGDVRTAVQISPSLRVTAFRHADDYTNEYFDRRDITRPSSAPARRLLSTRIDDDYTEYYIGETVDFGFALLADLDWRRLNILAGARYDLIDLESRQPVDKLLLPSANNFCPDTSCVHAAAADRVDGLSWTLSASYALGGLIPYVTASRQATIIAGQGAEVATASIAEGTAFDDSTLLEFGIKGSMLDDTLYFALAAYEQERTDYSAQQTVTNQASRTEGMEFELRWVVTDRLLMTLGFSTIEVVNLNTLQAGARFSFIGAGDVPGIPPQALYGGALAGSLIRPGPAGARRAGIPEEIWSVTGTYDFGHGLAASVSVVDVTATPSGFSGSVVLPACTLVNAGIVFETRNWVVSATAKNLTDERYFRANFPNLFGGVVVLPELPRHFAARIEFQW